MAPVSDDGESYCGLLSKQPQQRTIHHGDYHDRPGFGQVRFQLHAVDADGAVVWRKKVRRGALLETLAQVPACLVGMEACATAITGRVRYPLWVTKFV